MIVAIGPGGAEMLPAGAVRVLVAQGEVDVRADDEVRAALAALGVVHRAGASTVALPDAEAWALASTAPDRETWPERAALEARAAAAALASLWEVTLRLRRECPWDREQTIATIVPHTIEEAYEVADKALAGASGADLVDELGDLLFQTVFLAMLVREQGEGDLVAVTTGIVAKLVRRHPHVFGDAVVASSDDVLLRWEQIKRDVEGREGIFHDVPEALPGLLHARKVQRRAASVGFDFADHRAAWPAIAEELGELARAIDAADGVAQEAGDVLFATVNVLRLLDVDPELAVRAAAGRFRGRVEEAEALAGADGVDFRTLGLAEQDGYYRQAKALRKARER
jgi:XTP/dITP diphosphohydrolase/tetrapyrrole methylase family protein/MazG family protein/ATP diphosphatase